MKEPVCICGHGESLHDTLLPHWPCDDCDCVLFASRVTPETEKEATRCRLIRKH